MYSIANITIATDTFKSKISYLAFVKETFLGKPAYLWVTEEEFKNLIHTNTEENPFLFHTEGEAKQFMVDVGMFEPQSCIVHIGG